MFQRTRHLLLTLALATGTSAIAQTQATPAAAFPYYTAEQALQGVYQHQLPPLAGAFEREATQLVVTTEAHCQKQTPLATVSAQWQQTMVSWQALSSPEVGPVVARRSQREIDFWPTRDKLLQQAVNKAPQTLADMERVGTPAKGFPALEQLLRAAKNKPLNAAACHYASLVAQGIAAEAKALNTELGTLANKDWSESPEDASAAFAEWINQWLGGLERLRWAHIEKPLQAHRTSGKPVELARQSRQANLADWRAQWRSLHAMARLKPEQYAQPPQGGQALVPIEALLIGKGQLALAQRWAQAVDRANTDITTLPPGASEAKLLAMTQDMKALTLMYQNEVAAALDVPLGFSSADGD